MKGFMKEMNKIFAKHGSYLCGYSIDMNFTEISGVYFRSTRRKTYSTDRHRLWEGQNGKCHWCDKQCVFYETEGSALFTVDHVIPLSLSLIHIYTDKKRDQIKNQYCQENNLKLLLIPYWDEKNINKILKMSILSDSK